MLLMCLAKRFGALCCLALNSRRTTALRALKAKTIGVEDVLASPKWPDEWPFTETDLRSQDESDDGIFYSMPRFCYHVDEGAVRGITNYYKSHIADDSSVLDLCSSWASHYPADFPERMRRIAATGTHLA